MKDNLQFRVSAELKNILGRDLITSPDIAILELVKNSYDAHATKVEITFDKDYLCIADNGKGMTKDDLINKKKKELDANEEKFIVKSKEMIRSFKKFSKNSAKI